MRGKAARGIIRFLCTSRPKILNIALNPEVPILANFGHKVSVDSGLLNNVVLALKLGSN